MTMKFSWKSLSTIIDLTDIKIEKLANQLVLAGFEIDHIDSKSYKDDLIIDIDIPANRPDVECVFGLAKEISIILNRPLRITSNHLEEKKNNGYSKTIFINSKCTLAINIQYFELINIVSSPKWLANYLIKYNIEPINNITDIINYINIKWGQNIEIINLKEITNQPFNINLLSCDKNITLEYDIIKYDNWIISPYNLRNKHNYQRNTSYSSIILLGILYNSTSKQNNLLENRIKYISVSTFMHAYQEAVELIIKLTGSSGSTRYSYYKKSNNNTIKIKKNLIQNILGPIDHKSNKYLSTRTIFDILRQLEFQPKYNNNTFIITVPTHRSEDIKRPIDIIEEIGRIHGFDTLEDNLPVKLKYQKGDISSTVKQINNIRYNLRSLGLHEIINYSLKNQENKKQIILYNPLLQEQASLRDSLVKNLINTKKSNTKQKNLCLEGFEIGTIFYKTENNKYKETKEIAGILGSNNFARRSWSQEKESLNWFQAKGALEELFDRIHANIQWTKITDNTRENYYNINIYKHKRSALLYNKFTQEKIGIFGELKAKLNNNLNISHRTYIFEISIDKLISTINYKNHLQYIYKPYSYYPSVTRDISIKLTSHMDMRNIKAIISKTNHQLIESITLVNEYEKIIHNQKEKFICLHITYRAQNRTLNDTDISTIDQQINSLKYLIYNNSL